MKSSNILSSFKYAITGIKDSYIERNLKIQVVAMILVIIVGFIVQLNSIEWTTCIILFALVIGGELFNTAIENTIDFIEKNRNGNPETLDVDENARKAKDISAGAVLILSIAAAIIGLIIFVPKTILLII